MPSIRSSISPVPKGIDPLRVTLLNHHCQYRAEAFSDADHTLVCFHAQIRAQQLRQTGKAVRILSHTSESGTQVFYVICANSPKHLLASRMVPTWKHANRCFPKLQALNPSPA